MDRIARFGLCGRRDDVDCKYVTGADRCCGSTAGCYQQQSDSCYSISSASSFTEDDYNYCTEQYFWINNYVPAVGFEGTVCGSEGFGGLDPHFQVGAGNR